MALPEEFLERLRANVDIEDVISPYVNLKRRGRNLVGLCPFHGEKTPSFVVYKDTQSFFCFGCEAGGDAITFVKNIENLSYMEAVKSLADRAGLPLPDDGYDDRAAKERKEMLSANREAARFFHNALISPGGEKALSYIRGRGLTNDTIVKYGLGFAPDSWDSLYKHLKGKGYSDYTLYKAALISQTSKGNYIDQFRNRLIFPIIDLRGNVVAFGGRDLGDRGPKYLNSSETPVYKKSHTIFALNVAKDSKAGRLILTEGYMDTISLHQAGFTEAVATCGTALTSEQANVMARYTNEVILSYDSDEPGRKATARATPILKGAGIDVRVINYEGAKDPDEFIKKFGVIRFKNLIEGADTAADYEFELLMQKYDIKTDSGRIKYLSEAVEFISKIPSKIEREVYAAKLANQTGITKETIFDTVEKEIRKNSRKSEKDEWRKETSAARFRKDTVIPEKADNLSETVCEEKIISIIMRHEDYLGKIKETLTPGDFVGEFHKKVYEKMLELHDKGAEINLTQLTNGLSSGESARLAEYLADTEDFNFSYGDISEYAETLKRLKMKKEKDVKSMTAEEYKEYMEKLIKSKK